MLGFKTTLIRELMGNICNRYEGENWDYERFGELKKQSAFKALKTTLKKGLKILKIIGNLSHTYDLLNDEFSKDIFVKLIAYQILGYRKIKLPLNTPNYWVKREEVFSLIQDNSTMYIDSHDWSLNFFKLDDIGYPLKLYSRPAGIMAIYILQQYVYNRGSIIVKPQPGDYVIDAGGCWGDTALFFSHTIGQAGRVYTFEFIPDNVGIMARNFELNPELSNRVEIIQSPLGDSTGSPLFCSNRGPSSRVSNEKVNESDLQVFTLSIDDFVESKNIPKVDFIKMDIEGAELAALLGAKNTIEKYRPKLAISLYHDLRDFASIPRYLSSLNYGYEYYLNHSTIHSEETILFAMPI